MYVCVGACTWVMKVGKLKSARIIFSNINSLFRLFYKKIRWDETRQDKMRQDMIRLDKMIRLDEMSKVDQRCEEECYRWNR